MRTCRCIRCGGSLSCGENRCHICIFWVETYRECWCTNCYTVVTCDETTCPSCGDLL